MLAVIDKGSMIKKNFPSQVVLSILIAKKKKDMASLVVDFFLLIDFNERHQDSPAFV